MRIGDWGLNAYEFRNWVFSLQCFWKSFTFNLKPCTLYHFPYTVRLAPYAVHRVPLTIFYKL